MGNRIIAIVFFLVPSIVGRSAEVKGKITLTPEWRPVIYLSQLNSFDDLNTASYHLLIAEAHIDSNGYFLFDSLMVPVYDMLYRLHICKLDDPVSTIIIGGKEQNHVHFLMNAESQIDIDIQSFHDTAINGHPGNETLHTLFDIKNQFHAPLDLPSDQNRKMHRKNIKDRLYNIATASTSNVNRLLAVYFLDNVFGSGDFEDVIDPLANDLLNMSDSSPYFAAFNEKIQFYKFNNKDGMASPAKNSLWYLWLIIPVLAFIAFLYIRPRSKKFNAVVLDKLSIQEKKVYDLLCIGKTNKEISAELHIEVSTVKSHVYKIFNKLGIKSRKELFS